MKGLLTAELTDFHKTKCYLYPRRWLSWMILISVSILVGLHCCNADVHYQIYSNNKKTKLNKQEGKKILCFRKNVKSSLSILYRSDRISWKTERKNMFFFRVSVKRERGSIYYYCQMNAFLKKKPSRRISCSFSVKY